MPNQEEKLSTIKEVASRFKVSERTIQRWINAGEIEVMQLGRQIRVAEGEIKRFLDLRRRARARKEAR